MSASTSRAGCPATALCACVSLPWLVSSCTCPQGLQSLADGGRTSSQRNLLGFLAAAWWWMILHFGSNSPPSMPRMTFESPRLPERPGRVPCSEKLWSSCCLCTAPAMPCSVRDQRVACAMLRCWPPGVASLSLSPLGSRSCVACQLTPHHDITDSHLNHSLVWKWHDYLAQQQPARSATAGDAAAVWPNPFPKLKLG